MPRTELRPASSTGPHRSDALDRGHRPIRSRMASAGASMRTSTSYPAMALWMPARTKVAASAAGSSRQRSPAADPRLSRACLAIAGLCQANAL